MRYLITTLLFCVSFLAGAESPTTFEVWHKLDSKVPPANIAATKEGRIFLSTHQAYGSPYKLLEITKDGQFLPYPNEQLSKAMFSVLGVVADTKGILWFLDTRWDHHSSRVIGWDTKKEALYREIYISRPHIGGAYILNDLAVDRKNNAIYITDTADAENSALLVVDITTGKVRRVLSGSPFTTPEDKDMVIEGKVLPFGEGAARIGVNPITIDPKNEWVYFAPMTSEALYRVQTKDLLDDRLSEAELRKRVERFADKPMSDGITIDKVGNVYISDITNNALGVVTAKGEYKQLFQDPRLAWVEGFANDGKRGMLATANQLHRSKAFNKTSSSTDEFYIIRFKPLAHASHGR